MVFTKVIVDCINEKEKNIKFVPETKIVSIMICSIPCELCKIKWEKNGLANTSLKWGFNNKRYIDRVPCGPLFLVIITTAREVDGYIGGKLH